ncbi:MAG: hypothetical protein IJR17_05925 [Clostridia bacterium]|nr:hypothetical protein [Clostridia bacterium]
MNKKGMVLLLSALCLLLAAGVVIALVIGSQGGQKLPEVVFPEGAEDSEGEPTAAPTQITDSLSEDTLPSEAPTQTPQGDTQMQTDGGQSADTEVGFGEENATAKPQTTATQTKAPTAAPTQAPTVLPTAAPVQEPTPTTAPEATPTATPKPTDSQWSPYF